MQKNLAGQKWQVFAFNRTTGDPKTGDAANITANIRVDWGNASALNDTNPIELEDGYYLFDLTRSESNGDVLALFPETVTSDIQIIAVPAVIYTIDLAIEAAVTAAEVATVFPSLPSYDIYTNANTYFEGRLHTLAWDEASSDEKTVALTEATQRIDRLRFSGTMVEDDQNLEFPRYYGDEAEGDEIIPNDIKIACYEIAMALLDGVDPDFELENMAVVSQGYSSVRMAKSPIVPRDHIAAGIPSVSAWRFLRPYLASARSIQIYRVS